MSGLTDIFAEFETDAVATAVKPYGCGHINDTYLVATNGPRFILQRINDYVFPDVDALMSNVEGVTSFIASRSNGSDDEALLRIVKTKSGNNFLKSDGKYYRVYNFIEGGVSIETAATPRQFELSGNGFGRFQKLLDGYPVCALKETIENFHNTSDRLRKFKLAVKNDACGRLENVYSEVEFFLERSAYASIVPELVSSGKIPQRVTHNDTKINNVLIDDKHGKAVAVIDLDTVMPGTILFDFGDSIRSGANTAAEDERDLSLVGFSVELYEAFTKGFLAELKDSLTSDEIEYLPFGAILMTYECGMRFLTDYLEGDLYFKVHRDGHNLDRARTQIKMVRDMEASLERMRAITAKYAE